jgi:UDP-glucose 4-epimerase
MEQKSLSNNSRVLITGGDGYIGRATLSLLSNSLPIDIHSNNPTDLIDYKDLYNLIVTNNIKAVLHLAALKSIPDSKNNPTEYYFNNLVSSLNLLRVCEQLNIPMVFASSAAVYYGENPYSRSKSIFEQLLKESKVNHIILRYFNVGGLIEPPSQYQVGNVFDVIRSCVRDSKPFIVNRKTFPRDYSHVMDVANINVLALSIVLDGLANLTYDVCSGIDTDLDTILTLYKEYGVEVLAEYSDALIETPKKIARNRFPYQNALGIKDIVRSEILHGLTGQGR